LILLLPLLLQGVPSMSQQQQQATVKTPEDQLREAEVRAAKAAISPNGYLIKAPVSWLKDKDGRDLAGQVPLHRLNIHRHIVPDGTAKGGIRKVDGGSSNCFTVGATPTTRTGRTGSRTSTALKSG
jgi:hypothetical protein